MFGTYSVFFIDIIDEIPIPGKVQQVQTHFIQFTECVISQFFGVELFFIVNGVSKSVSHRIENKKSSQKKNMKSVVAEHAKRHLEYKCI